MRLIDADELKKNAYPFPCAIGVEYAVTIRAINEAPTVDAEQVRHGRWIKPHGMMPPEYHHRHVCSVCHAFALHEFNGREQWSFFCPNCGAKMDAKEE